MFGVSNLACLFILFIVLLEICLRFYRLKYSPFSYRMAYAFFLLRSKCFNEIYAINQRVARGGFRNFDGLFTHYSKVSGKSLNEIKRIYLPGNFWKYLLRGSYESGGHCVLTMLQKMHAGVRFSPNQKLKALNTDSEGYRKTGYEHFNEDKISNQKTVLLLGGSVLYGLGATSDEATIPGRVGFHLNKGPDNNSTYYRVINGGMLGYNSYQELLALMEMNVRPDYVVSLSGWNEVDQSLAAGGGGEEFAGVTI